MKKTCKVSPFQGIILQVFFHIVGKLNLFKWEILFKVLHYLIRNQSMPLFIGMIYLRHIL
jgi:hypothetical protein